MTNHGSMRVFYYSINENFLYPVCLILFDIKPFATFTDVFTFEFQIGKMKKFMRTRKFWMLKYLQIKTRMDSEQQKKKKKKKNPPPKPIVLVTNCLCYKMKNQNKEKNAKTIGK